MPKARAGKPAIRSPVRNFSRRKFWNAPRRGNACSWAESRAGFMIRKFKPEETMNSLSESHIFIAGGSRGIGAAAAKLAAQAGAAVSITYHQRSDAADAVVAAITAAGG